MQSDRTNVRSKASPEVAHQLFRVINQQLAALNDSFTVLVEQGEWVCECADRTCIERLALPPAVFDRVEQIPGAYVVVAGHEGGAEAIERGDGYVVIRAR